MKINAALYASATSRLSWSLVEIAAIMKWMSMKHLLHEL